MGNNIDVDRGCCLGQTRLVYNPNMGLRDAADFYFGKRVRDERERRGWSQEELAKRLTDKGIPVYASTIAKIESKEKPRAARLGEAAGIADLFGVSLDSLLGRKPRKADRDLGYALGALLDAVSTSQTELRRTFGSLRDRLDDIPADFAGYHALAGHGREVFAHVTTAHEVLSKLEDQLITDMEGPVAERVLKEKMLTEKEPQE